MDANKKIIGAVCIDGLSEERTLTFEQILLDETLAAGKIWVAEEAMRKVGGINRRLPGKRSYELLLRIAQKYDVVIRKTEVEHWSGREQGRWICLKQEESDALSGVQTDCYLIGRYKDVLLSMGVFDDAVLGVLAAGDNTTAAYLEKMLTGTDEYEQIYDATQPILIYVGDEKCYGVLDTFARYLGRAFEGQGIAVEYFNLSEHPIEDLSRYIGKRFQAVISMQSYIFSAKMKDGRFAHDLIKAPLYHFVFDHPVWMRNHLEHMPRRETVLTPDGNYARFIETYYGHPAMFFPPAGCRKFYWEEDREYGISFLGSCKDELLEQFAALRKMDKKRCHFMNRYVLYMRNHLHETPEQALTETLKYYGISCSREDFLEWFHSLRWAIIGVADYYRRKIVQSLLDGGIILHVFGDSWKRSPMWGHPGMICHEAVSGDEALKVYARSKLSLNIMTWHKDGFTERIANAMLQKSVVVTDWSAYLEQNFENGTELMMFELSDIDRLPGQIRELLSDEERCARIAEAGYRKAVREHTWEKRAETMLDWIESKSS